MKTLRYNPDITSQFHNTTVFSLVIPGLYPEWLHHWGLSSRPTPPPAPTLASTFPLPTAHHLWAGMGRDAVPGGPSEPAWLRSGVTLHERWRVLLAPAADRSGEDGGLVPEHGERGRGERITRGGWVWEKGVEDQFLGFSRLTLHLHGFSL